jgi:O-antigen/teichoic acid export membrane protein
MCGFADLLGLEQLIGWALVPYWVSLLTGLSGTPKGYFRLTGRFDLLTYNQVFNSALQLAASAVLWYLQAPLEMYLVVLGVTSCFSGITLLGVMLLALRRSGLQLISPFRTHSTRRYFRTFLKVAFGNGVLSSLTTSRYQLVLFIMPGDAGAAATGLFAAASRCASAITRCLVPFSQVVFPEVLRLGSRAKSLEVQHAMKRVTIATGLCALLLTAAGVIWSRSLVDLACGSEFSSAASTLSLLIAAEALRWAGFHLSAFVVATKGQAPLLKANALISSITVLAALVSIGPLEEVGGGLAVLLGSACSYVSLMHIARSPRAGKMPAGGKVRG